LTELYAYYRRNQQLTANIVRDVDFLPEPSDRGLDTSYDRMRDALASGWPVAGGRRKLLSAVLRHAVDFRTWESLAKPSELDDGSIIELMSTLAFEAAGYVIQRSFDQRRANGHLVEPRPPRGKARA
jgi:hypothetical protein